MASRVGLGPVSALDHSQRGQWQQAFRGVRAPTGQAVDLRLAPLPRIAHQIYVGIVALVANLVVVVVFTLILRMAKARDGIDDTLGTDYHVDEGDAGLRKIAAQTDPTPEPMQLEPRHGR